jgi:2-hydroxychromene-2-carboxylate isomerase
MHTPLPITIFTDPTCPFAYSAEPSRLRLKWLYGDQLLWQTRMIVLSGHNGETSPMTPPRISKSRINLRKQHGMPMDDTELPRVPDSIDACRAFVAVRRHDPATAEKLLRFLRIAVMSGKLVDYDLVIMECASRAGLDAAQVAGWIKEQETESELNKDVEAARNPGPVALNMQYKLSRTSSGQVRYSAPSYVFTSHEPAVCELPGFWPIETYEAAIGNLLKDMNRANDPKSVDEVLEWADTPLATIEVARICNKDVSEIQAALEKVADFMPVGQDGFWTKR